MGNRINHTTSAPQIITPAIAQMNRELQASDSSISKWAKSVLSLCVPATYYVFSNEIHQMLANVLGGTKEIKFSFGSEGQTQIKTELSLDSNIVAVAGFILCARQSLLSISSIWNSDTAKEKERSREREQMVQELKTSSQSYATDMERQLENALNDPSQLDRLKKTATNQLSYLKDTYRQLKEEFRLSESKIIRILTPAISALNKIETTDGSMRLDNSDDAVSYNIKLLSLDHDTFQRIGGAPKLLPEELQKIQMKLLGPLDKIVELTKTTLISLGTTLVPLGCVVGKYYFDQLVVEGNSSIFNSPYLGLEGMEGMEKITGIAAMVGALWGVVRFRSLWNGKMQSHQRHNRDVQIARIETESKFKACFNAIATRLSTHVREKEFELKRMHMERMEENMKLVDQQMEAAKFGATVINLKESIKNLQQNSLNQRQLTFVA